MDKEDRVLCPYCGAKMKLMYCYQFKDTFGNCIHWSAGYGCVKCDTNAPMKKGRTEEEAKQKAKAAALKRYMPVQKPLTLEELRKLEKPCSVWCEYNDDSKWGGRLSPEIVLANYSPSKYYGVDYRCWLNKPTDEERKAAKWGLPDV